jgi:undecaprenyl-diphosphatase
LGLVEGLTEFIPVSSTGHLIIAGHFLNFEGDLASTFEIFIQLGAILAVVAVYWKRFAGFLNFNSTAGFGGLNGIKLLFLTTLPALILGALLHGFIKLHLFNIFTVAIGLGVGGVVIILAEKFLSPQKKSGLDSLTARDALLIGLFQCLALWPGVSRSAATILGAMAISVERKTAAEYSFFAAVPVLCAAAVLDLAKSYRHLNASDFPFFALGFFAAFVSALFSIRWFIGLVSRKNLSPFGWYRIAAALTLVFLSKSLTR